MAVYQLTRFEISPDALLDGERALHDHASHVRATQPGTVWTVYREHGAPHRCLALTRLATDRAVPPAFEAALAGVIVGAAETVELELVTSSDLAPRPRAQRSRRR